MTDLYLRFIESSITISIIVLMLILLSPLLNRIYNAKWKYLIWLLLALRLVLPFKFHFYNPPLQISVPAMQLEIPRNTQTTQTLQNPLISDKYTLQFTDDKQIHNVNTISFICISTMMWLFGIALFAIYQLISYYFVRKRILRWSHPAKCSRLNKQFKRVLLELGVKKQVKILISKRTDSPMMIGLIKPLLLLPDEYYTDEELYFILKHELVHFKRRDIWYKLILLTANAVHWYNPVIYMMCQEANKDLELSCDSEVIKDTSFSSRKQYSEIILASVHRSGKHQTVLTTNFYGGYKILKERIRNIFNKKARRRGMTPLMLTFVSIILITGLVACSTQGLNSNPSSVVTKYLEAMKDNDLDTLKACYWEKITIDYGYAKEGDLGVISLSIDTVKISDKETQWMKEYYSGGDLAKYHGWSDEYIEENMIAVFSSYKVAYDNTIVPNDGGDIKMYFYLLRADKDSSWVIWDRSYDVSNEN